MKIIFFFLIFHSSETIIQWRGRGREREKEREREREREREI